MSIGSFSSPFRLCDDEGLCFVIDPIEGSIITNPNSVERFMELFRPKGAGILFQVLDGLRNGRIILVRDLVELLCDPFWKINVI